MNGVSKQEMSYTYILEPLETGEYIVPSASLLIDDTTLMTPEISYTVIDNPEGILQKNGDFSSGPSSLSSKEETKKAPQKPKRKLKRI